VVAELAGCKSEIDVSALTAWVSLRRARRYEEIPVWVWILIEAVVVVAAVAIIVVRSASGRKRTGRLKERFGSEYERTVVEAGEQRAAEDEFAARERKARKLDIVPLTPQAREK
jgi:hypothetical protein